MFKLSTIEIKLRRVFLLFFYFALISNPSAFAQPTGWQYRTDIAVSNTGGDIYDYQLKLTVNTAQYVGLGQMLANGDDIRFGKDVCGTTLFPYYIESGMNTANTVIWVKIDSVHAATNSVIYMFYGNAGATAASTISVFNGPFSATNQTVNTNLSGSANAQRGFRFTANEDLLVTTFGKYEPNGVSRYVTLFDNASQNILRQEQINGPAATHSYGAITPIWLQSGTQYLIEIFFPAGTDAYYFGAAPTVNSAITYQDMRYCNGCSQNTFPTNSLGGMLYGYVDFQFYTKTSASPAPTYTLASLSASIVANPAGAICSGTSVTFTATATNAGPAPVYQWKKNSLPVGTNSDTYTDAGLSNSDAITCEVSNGDPCLVPVVSNTINTIVNALPTVNATQDDTLCNGESTAISFSGAVPGTTYTWTNDNTSIGLAANGSGDIASFAAVNITTTEAVATVIVTPNNLQSDTFNYTGAIQTFTVPANIYSITVDARGAKGGDCIYNQPGTKPDDLGGHGGRVTATYAVTPGQMLNLFVGGVPYNGGGNGAGSIAQAAGGGASDIRIGGTTLADRVIVAGGGGGGGNNCSTTAEPGGSGGGLTGGDGWQCGNQIGTAIGHGGTQSGGGAAGTSPATVGVLGIGGNGGGAGTASGGGGGGYYGGGGAAYGGGGGGSSYTDPAATSVTHTQGYQNGNGQIIISYQRCQGTPDTFVITVKPTPTVAATGDQSLCNGAATTAVSFSGAITGTTYNWTNNTTSIGLAASGSGNIASFNAVNNTSSMVTAEIIVTPTANGCPGTPDTFTITVKPTTAVTAVTDQVLCNGDATTAVIFAGGITGTTYNWVNDNTSIGLAANGSTDIASFTATNTGTTNDTAIIIVTPTLAGCPGEADTFKIVVKPTPTVNAVSNQSVCNTQATTTITLGGTVAGTTYNWTNNTTSIGLAASGSGDIASFTATNTGTSPVIGTITVTPTADGCPGSAITPTITVKPTPTVNAVSNQSLCNGTATTAITFSGAVTGTTYNWTNNTTSIGLAASGSGDIASFTATNTTAANVTGTITVTPTAAGCPGASITPAITVKPTPTVNAVSNQSLCSGAATTAINFTGAVTGTTYNWTNNTTSIGLAASGSGDIASFTATNTGAANATGTITVTPTANGCPGTAIMPTITVKPTPTVNTLANQSLCNDAATAAITFSGAVAGTVYNWTNNNTSIGLAASGTGDIASFTATNTTAADVIATITITPTADGCPGTATTTTITVKPTPTVTAASNQSVCNGAPTAAITFGGAVTGTTYNWTNNTTSIGLAASGTGDIASFTATNTGTASVTGTITVTPTAAGCPGASITPTITVKPTPTVNAVSNQSLCNGTATTAITFSGAVTGTTYNWTNNTTSIGLAASGTGNIASFTATNTGAASVTATITVTPTAAGCPGSTIAPTITVKPTPDVTTVANVSVCNGASTAAINFSGAVTGTTFVWANTNPSIGLVASGTGNIASFMAINTGTSPISGTITVTPTANGCPGPAKTFTITVNPTPTVNVISNQIVCNNEPTTAVNFSGGVTGTTFNWSNNTASIGLAASGSGNIPSFTATNTTASPVTATITTTPVANTCSGSTRSFTILVNPTPKVTTVPDKFVCNNTASGDINFSSTTSGTTFAWTNSNTAIGLAASGTGDILSFTGTNPGAAPITATISVTPTANGCMGPVKTFVITINPTIVPTISIVSSAPANTICIHTNVTFTASATNEGVNPVYQWKKNGTNVGTNSPVYDDNHLTDGDVITCDLLSSLPCPSSVAITSNAITTNVNMYVYHTIDIFSDKQGDTLCAGELVNFTSVITNGGSAPVYQWMKNGLNVGTNNPTYSDPRILDGDRITCSLTTNVLCPAASTITNSNRIVMRSMSNVTASVVIVGVYNGTAYVFHSQTTNCGANPSYQWLLNGSPIPGATKDSLWITSLKDNDKISVEVVPNRRCTNNPVANSNRLSRLQVTSVNDIMLIDKLTLAPNPNNGNFVIEGQINGLLQLKDADLVVTNMVGQVMYHSKIDVHNGQLKAELQLRSVLVSGTYHLSILSNGQKYDAKFVVIAE